MKTQTKVLDRFVKWKTAALAAAAVATLASTPALAGDDNDEVKFNMVSSAAFLPQAHGRVKIESAGPVEIMSVKVWGLPPNTDFDFFVIQKPTAPFGLSWYQGDIETNRFGVGFERFVGRFSIETFIVAPGTQGCSRTDPSQRPPGCKDESYNRAGSHFSFRPVV
jgi:hypothetical protein